MAITYVSAANFPFGVSPLTVLAGAYESRATQIARLFVPLASFAGDTAQTLTDGSFNSNNNSILKSSSAVLASPSNIKGTNDAGNPAPFAGQGNDVDDDGDGTIDNQDGGAINPVTAKPLIIKVRRDEFTGEITAYGVFNADGSVPGQPRVAGQPLYIPGGPGDPFDLAQNPRYAVDRMTGQVYLNNGDGIVGINLDGAAGAEIVRDEDALEIGAGGGTNLTANVVGIVEFKALEGAALSTAQQRANELSNVIQSLSTLIRGFKDSERSILNALR